MCEMASALLGWLSSRPGCVLGEMSAGHQEKQGKFQGDIKEHESPRMEGGGELRICKAALHLSVQQLFLPSQLYFFPYLLEVGLHCFGLGSEEVRRLLSIFNVRYKL